MEEGMCPGPCTMYAPIIVKVFPDPVCPLHKREHTEFPTRTLHLHTYVQSTSQQCTRNTRWCESHSHPTSSIIKRLATCLKLKCPQNSRNDVANQLPIKYYKLKIAMPRHSGTGDTSAKDNVTRPITPTGGGMGKGMTPPELSNHCQEQIKQKCRVIKQNCPEGVCWQLIIVQAAL